MAQLMSIAAFDYLEPAERLAARLREAGFETEVQDESAAQKWQLYNLHPRLQFRVMTREENAVAVTKLINAWDAEDGALALAARCPECSSLRIEYPQFSRRTLMGALPAALAAAGVIERDFYCEACQFTWPEAESPMPELDALWWSKGKPVVKGLEKPHSPR